MLLMYWRMIFFVLEVGEGYYYPFTVSNFDNETKYRNRWMILVEVEMLFYVRIGILEALLIDLKRIWTYSDFIRQKIGHFSNS